MHVLVLYNNLQPAMPCTPKRARLLLAAGKAAVYRRVPFTIVLKHRSHGDAQPIELKYDPGSKQTGIALIVNKVVVFAANLQHRGQEIKRSLDQRRAQRRNRRTRKTRYRKPRFDNRRKPAGWLPPSLQSRVDNVASWTIKLGKISPITSIDVETVRFDTQIMQNPGISGIEYQQGELAGYEVREYLLEKWNRKCAYCDKKNVPLEIEHVVASTNGGSDRISNRTLACHRCNRRKGDRDVADFVTNPRRLKRLLAQLKAPLHDAAAVNATRFAIGNMLKATGLPTAFWTGGRTKMNRVTQNYPKDHWIDAACVGEVGANVVIAETLRPLHIKAIGRGNRQVCLSDDHGFRRSGRKAAKRIRGFQSGDLVKLVQSKGKYAGTFIGTASIRASGIIDLKRLGCTPISATYKRFGLLQRTNGYAFSLKTTRRIRDHVASIR
jgi:5-methylcytosine-specific restriction endonuclease McrA